MQTDLGQTRQEALEALPLAVLIVDDEGTIVDRNPKAEGLLPGVERIQELLYEQGGTALDWRRDLRASAACLEGLSRSNVTVPLADGRRLLVDVRLRPLGQSPGRTDRLLVVVEDATPRATMERRLVASERLASVGRLAGRVAHELNNPLDGVLRYIGLAERTCGEDPRRYLAGARNGLLRMGGIIRDLLGQAGASQSPRDSAPLGELLGEAVNVMQPRADAQGVAMQCGAARDGPPTVAGELFDVFCNVIKNALDAMPGGGELRIRTSLQASNHTIEFADTGAGLGPLDEEAIFQPFFTTKPPGEGSGLGLAICRDVVERCGGTIRAAARACGGTVITIDLPIHAAGEHGPA